jgi:hypothetical protein
VIRRVGKGEIDNEIPATDLSGDRTDAGSDRWKALPEAEQKAIYSDCAAINKAAGVTPGLPLVLSTPAPSEGAAEAYDED